MMNAEIYYFQNLGEKQGLRESKSPIPRKDEILIDEEDCFYLSQQGWHFESSELEANKEGGAKSRPEYEGQSLVMNQEKQ